MNTIQTRQWKTLFMCLMMGMVLALAGCVASQQAAPLADGTMVVKGKVIKIQEKDGITTLKISPPKGAKVLVEVAPSTVLKDLGSVQDIRKSQALEVHYRQEGDRNIAIMITPIAEGTC